MILKASNKQLWGGALLALFVSSIFVTPALAKGPVIRSGETVAVEANQVLEGDFYGFGQTITISGAAEHDVYALGGAVTTNAAVSKDLVVIGGVVQIHGEVKDDVRIIGGEVVIADPIAGDVVVVGGTVHILSTASIGGDLIFFGGEIRVDGPVQGAMYGTGESIRIDALVGNGVSVRAGSSLTLGDNAEIKGDVRYKSSDELTRAQGAVVNGTISHDSSIPKKSNFSVDSVVINILILLFSGLTIFFLAKSRTVMLVKNIFVGYGRLGLIGLGMVVVTPIVSVILMASIIGSAVGFILLLSYVALLAIACMCLPILLGALVQRIARLGDAVTVFTVILGVFVTIVLPYVPFVGGFALFLAFLVLIGALCNEIYLFFKRN